MIRVNLVFMDHSAHPPPLRGGLTGCGIFGVTVKKRSLLLTRKNILLKNYLFFSSQYLFKSIPWQRLIFFVLFYLSKGRKVDSDFPKLLDSSSNLLNQDLRESGLVIWIFNKCPSWFLSSKFGGNGAGVATQNTVNTRHYQPHLGARQAGSVSGPTWSQSHQNPPFNKVPRWSVRTFMLRGSGGKSDDWNVCC